MTAPDPATAEELQQEIERTREQLGETVEQLAAKADVKAQAQAKATQLKAQARSKATEIAERMKQSQFVPYRWPLAVAGTGVLMMGAAVIWRWRT